MDLFKSSGRPRGRWVALLVAGLLAGTVLIQPAVAHFRPRIGHIIKHVFTRADPRYVNNGEKAASAGSADTAKTADTATTANQATIGLSPVAYAHVLSDGNVDEAQSRGLTDANVALELTSTYCFRGLTFQFKTAQVTLGHGTTGGSTGSGSVAIPSTLCTPGAQVEVFTRNSGDVFDPEPFYIWFYN